MEDIPRHHHSSEEDAPGASWHGHIHKYKYKYKYLQIQIQCKCKEIRNIETNTNTRKTYPGIIIRQKKLRRVQAGMAIFTNTNIMQKKTYKKWKKNKKDEYIEDTSVNHNL